MLCRRKIDLYDSSPGQAPVLITQEMLRESAHASQMLARAKAQADEVLSQAAKQRDALLEQAQLAFWQRANAQLEQWEHQRQTLCNHLERYATSIADQALCCLLDDIPRATPHRPDQTIDGHTASQRHRNTPVSPAGGGEFEAISGHAGHHPLGTSRG